MALNPVFNPAFSASQLATGAGSMLSIERIYAEPSLSGQAPVGVKLSPDGQRMTFLRGLASQSQVLDLWQVDIKTGKESLLVSAQTLTGGVETLSDAEKARRERQRIASLQGIVEYQFSDDGKQLLFPLNGALYLYEIASGKTKRLTDPATGAVSDAKFSPKGRYVSFVRAQNLHVIALSSGVETALTTLGAGTISYGVAEFVAQEEMARFTGYWWAPDESQIAVQRIDEAPVPIEKRFEIYADRTEVIEQRYPRAGSSNVYSELWLLPLAAPKSAKKVDLSSAEIDAKDFYLSRVQWANSDVLSFQIQSRNQQRLELRSINVRSNKVSLLLVENSESYVKLHDELHFFERALSAMPAGSAAPMLWSSEASGYAHLELRAASGEKLTQLTEGEFEIESLLAVDAKRGFVYCSGNRGDAHQRQIYKLDVNAAILAKNPAERAIALTQLSKAEGTHAAVFARDASVYINTYSDVLTPPQVSLHSANGKRIKLIEANDVNAKHPLAPLKANLTAPVYGQLQANNQTLNYRIFKPHNFDAAKKYPALVYTYGGPGVQVLQRQWDGRWGMLMQYFAQQGYVVFNLDNRGSTRRGKAFESAIYRQMGGPDVADQLSGIRWLGQQNYVDATRIGVFGWSYGGYMSLHMMAQGGDLIAAGAAGAPVTDWGLYDTHYTERYMDLPSLNKQGYEQGTVFAHLPGLKARLLLIHGMADDNVLFSNSTQLMSKLQAAGTPFDLMTYPGMKHGASDNATRRHVFGGIAQFFQRELKPEAGQ
jgi:dipeptidyl-peptidase 4